MHDETLERIDAAIAALQNVEPDKASLAEPIIERLLAARRGLCEERAQQAADPSSRLAERIRRRLWAAGLPAQIPNATT
jgi:hypothetical protein